MDPQEKLEAMFCPRLDSTLVAAIYHDMGDFTACIPVLSALAAAAESDDNDDDDDDDDKDDVVEDNTLLSGASASAGRTAAASKTTANTSNKKIPPTSQVNSDKNILIWSEEVADAAGRSSGSLPSGLYKQGQVINASSFQRPATTSRNRSVVESTIASPSKPKPLRAVRNPNYKDNYFEALAEPEPIEDLESDEEDSQQQQQQQPQPQPPPPQQQQKQKQQQLQGKKNRKQKGSAKTETTDTLDDSIFTAGLLESNKAERDISAHLQGLEISDNQSANHRTNDDGSWQAPQEDDHQEEEDFGDAYPNGYTDGDFVIETDEVEFLRNCFPDRVYSDEYLVQILQESEGDLEAALDVILSQIFLESEQVETSSSGSGSMHSAGATSSTTTSSLDDAFFQGVPKSKRKSRDGGGGGTENGSTWKTPLKQNRGGQNDVLLNVINGQDEFLIPENNDWTTFDHQISILMNIFHTVPQATIVSEFHANGTQLFKTVESLEKRLVEENHYNSANGRKRQNEFDTNLAQLVEIFPSHSAVGLKKMLVYSGGNVQDAMNAVLAADFARAEQKERPPASGSTSAQSKRRVMVPLQADLRYGNQHKSLPSTSNPSPGGTRLFPNTLLDNSNAELYNNEDDSAWCRERAQELREQRNELFRKAAQMHRQSKGKGAGMGGISAYYADEGRKLDAMAKQWNMRAARAVIHHHRLGNNDPNLVDLHGLTIAEAHTVVIEAVTEWHSRSAKQSAPKPLKIVCGRGSHSKNKIARLYPHVLNLLMKDGWRCEAENGVILVKGIKPTPAPVSTSSRTRKW
ncbi:MAG: hypothetical protein J3Q66DRAFT_396297 [Benniella sp.]|nr:MAG: hypothetical protein J3Q66DRAFT_396297 [Benniella sp.]